jgi:hypothetical protein
VLLICAESQGLAPVESAPETTIGTGRLGRCFQIRRIKAPAEIKSIAAASNINGWWILPRNFELNLARVSFPDLDDCLTDPVFWIGVGGPAIVLAIVTLYFVWIDYKARMLSRSERKRRMSAVHNVLRLRSGKEPRDPRH